MTRHGYSAVRFFWFFAAASVALFADPAPVNAACVSPAGQSSHPVFKTDIGLQFCPDGDNWSTVSTSGTPGGSTGHVQFNNAGAFAGDAGLFWDNTNKRLGIGTAAPAVNLDITHTGVAAATLLRLENTGGNPSILMVNGNNSKLWEITAGLNFIIRESGGNNYFSISNTTGNVGVGTTSPISRFHSSPAAPDPTSGIDSFAVTTGGSYGGGIGMQDGTGNFGMWLDSTGTYLRMGFGTSLGVLTTVMSVNSSGNVGIGTASPGYKLHLLDGHFMVEGTAADGPNIRFKNNANNAWSFDAVDATNSRFRLLTEGGASGNVERLSILEGGNVGIGITTPSHILQINGQGRATNASWATSSDRRVKTNIQDLADGLDAVMRLHPVSFEYTPEYRDGKTGMDDRMRGFIAQEVEQVLPEMVKVVAEKVGDTEIRDFRLLTNSDFVPVLVKAVQELKADNDNLRAEIEALKAARR